MEHVPDRAIVAHLKRIDPGLSVAWVDFADGTGRWGVFYDLQVEGRFEDSVSSMAREIQASLAANGDIRDYHSCTVIARQALKMAKLVCYVINDDGSYRGLDQRIVDKIARMDYYRRHMGARDWSRLLAQKWDAIVSSRDRAVQSVYDDILGDKVLKRCISDILWGLRPTRSVAMEERHEASECECGAVDGESSGAWGSGDGGDGCGLSASDVGD